MPWTSIILCVNIPLTFAVFQIPVLVSMMYDAEFFMTLLTYILADISIPSLYLINQSSTLMNVCVCVCVWFAFKLLFDQHVV